MSDKIANSSSQAPVAGKGDALPDDQNSSDYAPKPRSKLARWYRSTLFNVIVAGMISFTQPGIWNALINTGAGGQQEPYLVNGANSLTFGLMVFGCAVFSALANKFGLKAILIVGTLGYAPYSASLYMNNRYGVEWFVLLGAALCGISASALWAAEGAIAVGYPLVHERGLYAGVWLGLRQCGQIIGGAINLSLNVDNDRTGRMGYATYLVLIALQCLGLPLALLSSPPHKAVRSDGTVVSRRRGVGRQKTATVLEFGKLWKLLREKRIYLLIPVLITFDWNRTYQGIYLTRYFSVRSRALASLTSAIVQTFADLFWGWFLDQKRFSRPKAAKITWTVFSVVMFAIFGWQVANEQLYGSSPVLVSLDWASPGFGRGFAVNCLFMFMNESHYIFVYWIVGTFDADVETVTLSVGIVRSFESLGAALAFGIGAARISPMINLAVAFAAFAVCVPPTYMVTFMVPEHPRDNTADESETVTDNN
ncbi:hypothetical protein MCOR02_011272 [Pyricularia oryzae]|uniref:DUF895 domain membrane protein n=1 Tax=Pyricularia oryzae TaxID=318829 RepID=A0A4P7N7K7_PYROR|nr:hypothetical protein MCOR02_011272 [Pyricularia oryzae]KAI6289197.1 hypothetical protein MCOR34_010771 [Pyricularia oryzae]KAI6452916.1 hypothetical protein MCOR17_009375 [Pyricularia oryzae]KAI6454051.1 hypothetical protein MCOR15_008378 [Pyricularia oryzae]KAI6482268.1 hypothetical protein MCOR13_010578 [Pyricularia oryzae]